MRPHLTEQALRELERASTEHLAWLKKVHCSLLFRQGDKPPVTALPPGLAEWARDDVPDKLDPTDRTELFSRMRRARQRMAVQARILTTSASGEGVSQSDYLAFMSSVEAYNREVRQLESLLRQTLAETDPLTGVSNRRGMMRDLKREWTRAVRTGQPCCVAIADLDRFKEVNDSYGHLAGDRALALAAAFFLRRLRPYDLVYRFGGEEFLFCLPNTDPERARTVLDRLRNLMARLPVPLQDGRKIRLTASIGIADMGPRAAPDTALANADEALYRAKEAGRNRVCVFGGNGAMH